VQRSSESFAALAAALAKAQSHLVNPEKSLTATIAGGRPGEAARSFRYAPLSSGLEIVRKTLSEHEIAVIQTTAVDQASRMLTLTTLLAHSSGEWIASYWPVCSVAEIANPHRMGAALTYARRYSLFTLVGIAGEDDLDAPDLCAPGPVTGPSPSNAQVSPPAPGNGKMRATARPASVPMLPPDESAALRERLLGEIAALRSHESAATWAREALRAKNKLTAADAKALENAFEQRLADFSSIGTATPAASSEASPAVTGHAPSAAPSTSQDIPCSAGAGLINVADQHEPAGLDLSPRIDKSVLTISASRRYRSREHLRYVISQPCLFCARKPSDAHHLRFMQPRALGRKTSDEFVVPLCRTHHRAAHRAANEQAWWKAIGIDPVKIANKLWRDSCAAKGQEQSDASLQDAQTKVVSSTQDQDGNAR
jgi:ERF superfamily